MEPIYYENLDSQPATNEELDNPFEQPQQANTAGADLSYKHKARGHSLNNPPPDTWAYPHKKGIGTGSNLENFKDEIAARTQRGENCKAIAEALNEMGVQTSDRAVSRVRIKWGMRKRAQRKVKTPPPGSDAARLSAKSKVQALRKAELTRMTKEGITADEIYRSLTARGMELKKGVATVLRLQSAWGLAHDEKRWVGNFRHQCHKKARAQQLDAFSEIAKELGVQNADAWMQEKMSEESARQARHELALKLMGEHAPTNPERRKLQSPRRTDGIYVKQKFDTQTPGSGTAADANSMGQANGLRSHLANLSEFEAGLDQNDDGSSPAAGDSDGVLMGQTPQLSGIDTDMGDDNAPLNDEEDEDFYDSEGNDGETDSLAHVPTLGLQHAGNTMPPNLPSQPVPWPTAAVSTVASPSRSVMQTASTPVRQVTDASMSLSSATTTPNQPGRGRTMRQSRVNPAPIPVFQAPTSSGQTDRSPSSQTTAQVFVPFIPAAKLAATSVSPTTARGATTVTDIARSVPPLVLRTEEAEANKSTLSVLEQYEAAAKAYKELLEARNENKPLSGSLTGLPPSAKEVDTAKRTLKEVTQSMMLALD